MPAQIFGAAAAVSILNRAFANTSPAYAAYSNQVEAAKASLKAGDNANNALSYLGFAKDFGAAYATQTPEALSTLLLTNIGVLPSTDDKVKALEPALVDYIKANGVQNIGIIALQLGNIFTTLENGTGDLAVYNAAAVAWNNEITAAQAYSSNAANTIPQVGEQAVDGGENGIPLTNKTDKLSGNKFSASQVYTPGGDDRINSLQDEDVLTGTGTKPTLNADLGNANDNGATIITPKLVNIEVANLKFTGSGAAVVALDMQDATGLKEVNIERVSQASNMARVENIKQVLTNMSIASTNANNAGTVEFSFGAGVLAGDNTAAVKVDNVQIGAVNIGNNTSGVGAAGVGNQGYETINLESTGASNAIGTLNLPMDTGTAGKVTITGDKNLTLAAPTSVRNAVTNAVESTTYAGGIAQANGRLATVDATALTGNLTLNVGAGFLTTGKADTSGVVQNVSVLLGKGNDMVVLSDQVQAGDSLSAGEGTDTLVLATGAVVDSSSSVLTGFENVEVRAAGGGAIAADFDKLPDTKLALVRNEGAAGAVPAPQTLTTTLTNLTVAQAAALNILHSNTGSNAITQNVLSANLKTATGTTDTVVLSINEGSNTDPRFNFTLQTQNAAGVTGGVENLTLTNNDSESNTVALGTSGQHTGTVTTTSTGNAAAAGTFLNLDTTAAGANGGLYQYAVTGAADLASSNAGPTVMRLADHSGTAGQVRINAATFDASADAANIIVRMGNNAASVVGAQTVKTGAGNDTVIFDNLMFDNLADTRAGLTISDTVSGGAGSDTIALDGNAQITLGASEWTNVSGFEIIRLIGNGVAANNANATSNSYNLVLTDAMLAANKDATTGALQIIADNDLFNNTGRTTAGAAAANVGGVAVANDAALASGGLSLDARTVSAGSKWSFKGNEGLAQSADRLILSDKNIDGNATIDGGALDNISDNRGLATTSIPGNGIIANQGNADVIEVRNQAEVTLGDLANIRNIGTLSFTNDLAITQTSKLQLNDTIVDALVDSFQTSVSRAATTGANVEVLNVNAIDNMNVAAATTGLTIEGGALSDRSDVNVTLGRGANNVTLGGGMDRVVLLGNYLAGTYAVTENGVNINAQSTPGAAARVVTDIINLGAGTDTLVTYGAINLAGATLTGVENIVANSALVLTAAQYRAITALGTITFQGNSTHQLRIIGDGGAALDLSKIILAGGALVLDTRANVGGVDGAANTVVNNVVDNSATGDAAVNAVNVGTSPVNNSTLTSVLINFVAGDNKTGAAGTNDIFVGAQAGLTGTTLTGQAADTETLRLNTAGTVAIPATVTNIDKIELANGANTITFAGIINGASPVSVLGGTGADSVDLGGVGDNTATKTNAGSSVALGAGADTLLLDVNTARTGTLDGGADADLLKISNTGGDLSGATILGFETFNHQNYDMTMTAAQLSSFTTAILGTGIITVSGAGAFNDTATSDTTKYTLSALGNSFTGNAPVKYEVTGGAVGDTFSLSTDFTADDKFAGGTGTDTFRLTYDANGNLDFTALNITATENVVLAAAQKAGITVTLKAADAGFEMFDASANTNGMTLAGTLATNTSVKLGSGADTITAVVKNTVAQTVELGAGADTITKIDNSHAVALTIDSGTGNLTIGDLTNDRTAGGTLTLKFGTDAAATISANVLATTKNFAVGDVFDFATNVTAIFNAPINGVNGTAGGVGQVFVDTTTVATNTIITFDADGSRSFNAGDVQITIVGNVIANTGITGGNLLVNTSA